MKPSTNKLRSAALTAAVLAIALAAYEYPVLRFRGNGWILGGPGRVIAFSPEQ